MIRPPGGGGVTFAIADTGIGMTEEWAATFTVWLPAHG
jgi:hypothetical protein